MFLLIAASVVVLIFILFLISKVVLSLEFISHEEVPWKGNNAKQPLRSAVVIGGSFSGLCVAKVLSRHCKEVVILERGKCESNQPTVPHYAHVHTLGMRGLATIYNIFPGMGKKALPAIKIQIRL
jgi:hypothetical protein